MCAASHDHAPLTGLQRKDDWFPKRWTKADPYLHTKVEKSSHAGTPKISRALICFLGYLSRDLQYLMNDASSQQTGQLQVQLVYAPCHHVTTEGTCHVAHDEHRTSAACHNELCLVIESKCMTPQQQRPKTSQPTTGSLRLGPFVAEAAAEFLLCKLLEESLP